MACPIGGWQQIEVGGRTIKVLNPGPRAVMAAQEECFGAGGQISPSKYLAYIGSRWTDPKIDLDWFRHEGEVVEFMREWNEFRRPEKFSVELSGSYCPEGKTATITLSEGKKLNVLNPGMRWVLEAQDSCTGPSGRLAFGAYAERVLRDCVVGGAKLDDFAHEDEVVEFLRCFRLMRVPPAAVPDRETKTPMG